MAPLAQLLRRRLLPLLRRFNLGDITVRHRHTGDRIRIHSFRHKCYWFHGKHHETQTLRIFRALVPRGGTVLDVGGHIGYTTLFLAGLVGPEGRVVVFEPGPDNLKYLKHNTRPKPNVTVIEAAVTARRGRQTLFVEDLTGQNNSLIPDFPELRENARVANVAPRVEPVEVETVSLDDFCRQHELCPHFVKVDVEGFELDVMRGAAELLNRCRPLLLVEILPPNRTAACRLLTEGCYVVLDETGVVQRCPEDLAGPNVICVPAERAAEAARRLSENR